MVLRIPADGLRLESSPKTMAALPAQAFALTLSSGVLEDMIKSVQNGEGIKLSLGNNPTFLYGTSSHRISRTPEPLSYDLFLTNPSDSSTRAERLANPTMSLFRKPELNKIRGKPVGVSDVTKKANMNSLAKAVGGKDSASLDADIAALSNSLAQAEAVKKGNSTRILDGPLPNNKRGPRKVGKSMLGAKSTSYSVGGSQSIPSSPALSGIGSPALTPSQSASQQAADKAKEARSPIIHELAFREQTYDNLWNKYPGNSVDDFKKALEKVATLDESSGNYVLAKKYWRELDVWNHEYASDEERQQAIDNAVTMFDKLRLTVSEPEWDKLLPKEERGKGKCLSKVQAKIMRGPSPAPPAPKIKVQKAGDTSPETGSSKDDSSSKKKVTKGGEGMVRSNSQPKKAPAPTKKHWVSERKAATPKVSPAKATTKPTAKATAEKPSKFKSKEFISDSDSSGDESAPLSITVPSSKVVKKPVQKPTKETAPPKPRPAPKETIKPQITAKAPMKRPRDDDDSSSSSGTPLSKRYKVKETKPAPAPLTGKNRVSDSIQSSRGSGMSYTKSKNTSPAKSSPLASSPPTNASDMDQSSNSSLHNPKKRKADHDLDHKSKQQLTENLMSNAVRFKAYYEKYEAMHNQLMKLDNPPEDDMDDLLDMRQRLQKLKTQIYEAASSLERR